jgi:hypothetical protein
MRLSMYMAVYSLWISPVRECYSTFDAAITEYLRLGDV